MRRRYRGTLKRGQKRRTEYTVAGSPDQARRHFHKRFRGWSAVRVVSDPASRSNPAVPAGKAVGVTESNPFGVVRRIEYHHDDDGHYYYHDFGPGTQIEALKDGSLRIFHRKHRLWRDYR